MQPDPINPAHYQSGAKCACGIPIECIQITEGMSFLRGNAQKYLWRAGKKGDELEDLKKCRWYLEREIAKLEAARKGADAAASGVAR